MVYSNTKEMKVPMARSALNSHPSTLRGSPRFRFSSLSIAKDFDLVFATMLTTTRIKPVLCWSLVGFTRSLLWFFGKNVKAKSKMKKALFFNPCYFR